MLILQISDLHVSTETDCGKLREKIEQLGNHLKRVVPAESKMVCCLLGDFVDTGTAELYSKVNDLLSKLQDELAGIVGIDNLSFFAIPGNHDLCEDSTTGGKSLREFDKFASDFFSNAANHFAKTSIYENDCFGYHFISICTSLNGEHHYGSVDYNLLNQCSFSANTILLTHHALISGDDTDIASIRNGYELQRILEEKEVVALLHGHTHGCKRYTVGNDCQVIGVGPMFKTVADISNQCNLIRVNGSHIHRISTLIYQDDRKTWDDIVTYERNSDNNYYSESVYDLYSRLLRDVQDVLSLPNLRLQVRQKFTEFESEINEKFSEPLKEARVWQSSECPDTLTYTHGQLMNTDKDKWEQYVIETLRRNPTSKRALVPLIDKEQVFAGGDDKLVSFDVVQFGFTNAQARELYVTVYLRALEIRHFLPINLCEIYLMAKKIQESIQSIDSISVCLFAFRAEARQNYGCYKKSEIDLLSESEICKLLTDKKNDELKALLLQKANMCDTVIEEEWLIKVCNAVNAFYEGNNKPEVLHYCEIARSALFELKEIRQRCSDYSITQPQEDTFAEAIRNLAALF